MGNTIQIFKNSDFGEIRTIFVAGEPWFVAKDVCTILGIQNVSDAISKILDEDEADIANIYIRSNNGVTQTREVVTINESGLYHLIFVSRKPEARFFRRWVTHEVLPQIRKIGSYGDNSRGIRTVVDKMLDIQKQQMDIIRSLVDSGSSMDCNVYNETHGVLNSTQLFENDVITEYSGDIIRTFRHRIGISQKQLAERANIDRAHIAHIENNQYNPSVPTFFKLLKGLGYVAIFLENKQLKGGINE